MQTLEKGMHSMDDLVSDMSCRKKKWSSPHILDDIYNFANEKFLRKMVDRC